MAKSEYITGDFELQAAEKAAANWVNAGNLYPHLYVSKARIEMYGGNRENRSQCRKFLEAELIKNAIFITPRQKKYLRRRIELDLLGAITLNLHDCHRSTVDHLTKKQASQSIDLLIWLSRVVNSAS